MFNGRLVAKVRLKWGARILRYLLFQLFQIIAQAAEMDAGTINILFDEAIAEGRVINPNLIDNFDDPLQSLG